MRHTHYAISILKRRWKKEASLSITHPLTVGRSGFYRFLKRYFAHTSVREVQVGVWMLAYIKVRGVWKYLYRAVDKEGKTIDFLLKAKQDKAAAIRFFDKAMPFKHNESRRHKAKNHAAK
jgi:hypothetical protein